MSEAPDPRSRGAGRLLPWLAILPLAAPPPGPPVVLAQGAFGTTPPIVVDLGSGGQDMAVDESRQLLYVSTPAADEIALVSLSSFQVVGRLAVGDSPQGVELSGDRERLFVALGGSGAIAIVDLDTFALEMVDLEADLGHRKAFDLHQALPARLFVSANPSSTGFAHIVAVDLEEGYPRRRVAGGRIIRCAPTFEPSPDGAALYVGECFSPPSLYKLDLSDPAAPIVLEDDHGSLGSTRHLEVGEDPSRIYLAGGQVLDTSNFEVLGATQAGIPVVAGPSVLWVMEFSGARVRQFDPVTLELLATFDTGCPVDTLKQFLLLPGERGWLALLDDRVCAGTSDPVYPMSRAELASAVVVYDSPGRDTIDLLWVYELAPDSDGLDPAREAVRVSFGPFFQSLPPGAFSCGGETCRYAAEGSGIVRARLDPGRAWFSIRDVDLSGGENPMSGALEIGNDFGAADARLSGRLRSSRLPPPGP